MFHVFWMCPDAQDIKKKHQRHLEPKHSDIGHPWLPNWLANIDGYQFLLIMEYVEPHFDANRGRRVGTMSTVAGGLFRPSIYWIAWTRSIGIHVAVAWTLSTFGQEGSVRTASAAHCL